MFLDNAIYDEQVCRKEIEPIFTDKNYYKTNIFVTKPNDKFLIKTSKAFTVSKKYSLLIYTLWI